MASLKHIPFTYHWIVRRAIGDGVKIVLDLGCGEGDFMADISYGENWNITGVEFFADAAKRARKTRIYEEVVKADVTKLPKSVFNKKYDLVFSSQVLEHIDKAKGERALKDWEGLAKKRIVVTMPVGFIEYDPIEKKVGDNPLQRHLSGWTIKELRDRGYRVRGQGARIVYGDEGLGRKYPSLLSIFSVISLVLAPFVYFYPKLGTYMIAWKKIVS